MPWPACQKALLANKFRPDDLPGGGQHPKYDSGDEPDAAFEAVRFLLDAVHLGLVVGQELQDVGLAGLHAGHLFADVDEDGVIVSAHTSQLSAPSQILTPK